MPARNFPPTLGSIQFSALFQLPRGNKKKGEPTKEGTLHECLTDVLTRMRNGRVRAEITPCFGGRHRGRARGFWDEITRYAQEFFAVNAEQNDIEVLSKSKTEMLYIRRRR